MFMQDSVFLVSSLFLWFSINFQQLITVCQFSLIEWNYEIISVKGYVEDTLAPVKSSNFGAKLTLIYSENEC